MFLKSQEERDELGRLGREYALKQFNFETFMERWDELLTKVYEEKGSWETRTGYKSYGVEVL